MKSKRKILFACLLCLVSLCLLTGRDERAFGQTAQDDDTGSSTEQAVVDINHALDARDDSMQQTVMATSSQERKDPADSGVRGTEKVMKIKKSDDSLFQMELRNVDIQDLLRVLAHQYELNVVIDKDVKGMVTASFSNISLEDALRELLGNLNLVMEKEANVMRIRRNLVSHTFVLKYIEAKTLYSRLSGEQQAENKISKKGALVDLLSEDGKVFLGRAPNSLHVIDYPENIQKIEEYIVSMDRKMERRVFKLRYLSAVDIVQEAVEKK